MLQQYVSYATNRVRICCITIGKLCDIHHFHQYLHELKRCLKVLDRIHLHPEELQTHDETDGALDHAGVLLLLTELLQLAQKLLLHRREPGAKKKTKNNETIYYKKKMSDMYITVIFTA